LEWQVYSLVVWEQLSLSMTKRIRTGGADEEDAGLAEILSFC
jgi:hypothetical protein